MTNRTDSVQGEGGDGPTPPPPPGVNDHLQSRANNKVYKSGTLFISSKGIGWTSWKKRWFILTRTSLVFFRSDPNTIPLKGSEVNLTLGGIDLNSSGSVVVKEDKKLLTVLFADGRDGRTFTLKAETLEDLQEWKAALEEALANAPNAALVMGQNGIFKNDQTNASDVSAEQMKDRVPSMVIGRPILLALEDIDGSPSFLEKALRFVEEHGIKVEGILRQAADVDDVEHRIREYEEGKSEFSPEEDAHIIADCVKYVIRELPSSPVPASCCNALLDAYRTERSMRVSAMRTAICETFPEPNRRLLQRILLMMQSVATHKNETRMSISAVAACMAPLLLRPLLAGECELQHNFDMGGDGSVQLLQAAAAANLAQAIVITLLEEYDNIFGEGTMSAELYSESEDSGSESEELTDDDEAFEDDEEDYTTDGSEVDVDDEIREASNASFESDDETRDESRSQASHQSNSGLDPPLGDPDDDPCIQTSSESSSQKVGLHQDSMEGCEDVFNRTDQPIAEHIVSGAIVEVENAETSTSNNSDTSKGTARGDRRTTVWGRTTGKKNLSMESIDFPLDEEDEIKRLQNTKTDLKNRIAHESKENTRLQDSLEMRKNTLQERRLALQNEVTRLQEQLEKERELREALEAGLRTPQGKLVFSSAMDKKTKTNLEEIAQAESDISGLKQKADDIAMQLNQQREQNSRFQNEQHLLSPKDKYKVNVDHKNVDTAATLDSREKFVGTKNDNLLDKDKKQDVFLTSEISLQNQQTGQSQGDKSSWLSPSTSSLEEGPGRPSSTSTKRSASRGEGANSTSSALSKLSNRLNFLKERRAQITNELQGIDQGRSSDQQATQNPSETLDARQLQHNVDKCQWKPPESNKGSGSQRQQTNLSAENNSDNARKPDGNPNLDREKAKSIPGAEKGKATTKRTNSR